MVRELFKKTVFRLGTLSDCPEFEAEVIFEEIFGRDYKLKLLKDGDFPVSDEDISKIEAMVLRRASGEPLQYIVGRWEFYGLEIRVGAGALIPRQDTETLVDTALKLLEGTASPKVLDLCAGTGCVALAIKKKRPDSDVTALEKYPEAYKILLENIAADPGVKPFSGDALDEKTAEKFSGLDLITANPPYLTESDMNDLQPEVAYEPKEALFGGADGLRFYKIIPKIWRKSLAPGGLIAFETGLGQEKDVMKILSDSGYKNIHAENDLTGRARVVHAEK